MIQLNITSARGRASIFCDSYLAAYDEGSDTITLVACKGSDRIHSTVVTRDSAGVQVQLMYLDPDIAEHYNDCFQLKSLFPVEKPEVT